MIFKPKELKVFEDQDNLNITYSWFDSTAIPTFMFSLFWCGFLVMWYTLGLVAGAPLVMFLFPIIHVIVGISTMYSALTKLFNKTIIDVYYGEINIVHKPVPWIKGNTQLNQGDIEQFYVKEAKGKQGRAYNLRAKLKSGKDISILAINASDSHLILQLEERLEQFMEIEDQPVSGEYGKSKQYYEKKAKLPKRKRKTKIGHNFNYDLENGSKLTVKNNWLTVNNTTQYDWVKGNSDKLFQLISESGKENLLYVRKKGKLFSSYVEHELSTKERNRLKFNVGSPPKKLFVDGRYYIQTAILNGNQFLSDDSKPIAVKQWIYSTEDSEVQLRILKAAATVTIYKGKIIPDYYFIDPVAEELELRDIEDEKEIILEKEYRELESDNPWNEVF